MADEQVASDDTLAGPIPRREVVSWALFDAANSSFPLVVTSAVFVLYFKQVVVAEGDPGRGDALWGLCISLSGLLVALSSPFMGAVADARRWRKQLLGAYTAVGVVATLLLSLSGPGTIAWAMVFFIAANAAFEGGMVFYGALLSSVARPGRRGRVSGIGWATGYVGGLLCLALCMPLAIDGSVPTVLRIVAVWWAVFALPLFLLVRDRAAPLQHGAQQALEGLKRSLRDAWRTPDLRRFLIAFFLYNDAIITTFAFAAPFAVDELGFEMRGVIMLIMGVQITGAIGAFALGYLADALGASRTIAITLGIWLVVCIAAFLCARDLAIWSGEHGAALRSGIFVAVGLIVGFAMGATQATSRSLLSDVVPPDRSAEFFGLYAVAGKFSAVIGPAMFGWISLLTGSKAWSVLSLGVMFALGLILIVGVDEKRAARELNAA